jgi:CheY-like chemotaxis protein
MPRGVVFLLDDEPAVQAVVARSLEAHKVAVVTSVEWAQVAKQLLAVRDGPAVLVSDLDMPGIRGEDFCKTVRQYRPHVRIVLFSGGAPEVVAAVAGRLGVPFVLKRDGAARLCHVILQALATEQGTARHAE